MKFSNLLQYFSPKEKKFYVIFNLAASNIVATSEELVNLVNQEDVEERKAIQLKIKNLERQGDIYTKQVFNDLNQTFITPFDREDIQGLASTLDDVIDLMNGCSEKIIFYNCTTFSTYMRDMAKNINVGCLELQKAVNGLEGLKNPEVIMNACEEVDAIESHGDQLYHLAISNLFEKEKDAIELVRQKEILRMIEKASNKIEDAADVIKTILVKYS
jgi:predicted phosphate transport protein (TIGR00153 family)